MGSPRGSAQGNVQQQTQRYQGQQGPMVNAFGYNYGRGSEANYGDYTDIMNRYRQIAGGEGGAGGAGGGGGGGGGWGPSLIGYKDPFKSYTGYEEFSQTGGYSPEDIANMRARGVSPVRAMYGNVEREMSRQRALQGGYSPNFMAAMAKTAREKSQGMADALQNVEAGLAEAIRSGRLQGLGGMSGIETSRLGADLDVAKFNAQAQMQAAASNAAASRAAAGENAANQLAALRGMTSLYGTTPGMSELFGNQLLQGVGQGGEFGLGQMPQYTATQQLPGAWETTMGRIGDVGDIAGGVMYPW